MEMDEKFMDLEVKRLELQKRKNEFLRTKEDNDSYLQNYEKKCNLVQKELKIRELEMQQLDSEIDSLKKEVESRNEKLEALSLETEQYQKYRDILCGILENSHEFQNVEEVIGKYTSLARLRKELKNQKDELEVELKGFRAADTRAAKELRESTIGLTVEQSRAQETQEECSRIGVLMEGTCSDLGGRTLENQLLRRRLKLAVRNMYDTVLDQGNQKVDKTDNPVAQLRRVEQFLLKWYEVVGSLQKEETLNSVAVQKTQSSVTNRTSTKK